MPALGVTADVYDIAPQTILDLRSVEFVIGGGGHGVLDDAYWHVAIFPVRATFPPGKLEVTRQWFEVDANGNKTLHYVVRNFTPSPFIGTFCTFVRRLVRIPAR
jgi:hypothetical protein